MRAALPGARPIIPVSRCLHCGDPWEAHTDDYGCIVGPTTFTMSVLSELLDYARRYAEAELLGFANESQEVMSIKVNRALCQQYELDGDMLRVRAQRVNSYERVDLDISTSRLNAVSARMLGAMGLRITCRA